MARRAWSLALELATLAHAIEAVRIVADAASQPPGLMRDPTATAEILAGSLALTVARLHDIGRVVRGELDPRRLCASHNAVPDKAANDANDVIFRAWEPKRRATEARRALAQVDGGLAERR